MKENLSNRRPYQGFRWVHPSFLLVFPMRKKTPIPNPHDIPIGFDCYYSIAPLGLAPGPGSGISYCWLPSIPGTGSRHPCRDDESSMAKIGSPLRLPSSITTPRHSSRDCWDLAPWTAISTGNAETWRQGWQGPRAENRKSMIRRTTSSEDPPQTD